MKQVQHHLAHVLSCMAEHGLIDSVLGIAFDGTGLGTDGTNWGGEFLRLKDGECERVARLRPLPLPGGDAAAEEPRRTALGVLFELFGPERIAQLDLPTMSAFSEVEIGNLVRLLKASLNCPLTSSAGRLFDAVASILGICQHSDFEGQAAMRLQYAAETCITLDTYEFHFSNQQRPYSLDWGPTVQQIVDDIEGSEDIGIVACKFHNTLVNMILSVAENIGEEKVVLSGGCFQNRLLTELAVSALSAGGFKPYWQQRIPCNDSGIAIGQLYSEVLCGMEQ
jgi:hydrogenase maturation protein HypF